MNDYLLSLILGIIEGLTEFLPVSSTAHLRISEALLGIDLGNGYWKMFSIVIQLGAILCLPIYFWGRITEFLRDFPQGKRGDRTIFTHPLSLTIVAFVVTALPALLLTKVIGKHLESLTIMGWSLIIGGVVMWVVDAMYERSQHRAFARAVGADVSTALRPGTPLGGKKLTEDMDDMSVGQAVWIGFCQIFSAVFPGTSRSMSTITAGELAGMSRPAALEFSFFLSIPTMVVATLYDLYRSLRPHHGHPSEIGSMPSDAHSWIVLAIGFVVSFIVAYGVVAWFMNWVRTRGFTVFAVYRIIIGVAVLWWFARLHG
ncbi:MAG TPA: undecaprenyl-diphosphate phosphatase [Terriglobales bacterium]|nr:undecaprenyl-diphosphate phosphatase [Terriglobales bacterium]